jgi:hypothetical protein
VSVPNPERAPLANTNLLMIVSAGRIPIVTAGRIPDDPALYRLSLEVLTGSYGVNVHIRGPH